MRSIPKRYQAYAVFAGIYILFGMLFAAGYSSYAGLIIGMVFFGLIPTAVTLAAAVPFAYYYVQFHKRFFNPHPTMTSYEPNTSFKPQIPKLRAVIRSTIITNFGILHLIVSASGLNLGAQMNGAEFGLLILALMFATFLSPSLNIASWLLTRTGVMYENRIDGTRTNIGRDLRTRLEYAIGPVAAGNFIRVVFTSGPDYGFGIAFIIGALLLSVPSAFVTMLLLRAKALDKLSSQLNERLKKSMTV